MDILRINITCKRFILLEDVVSKMCLSSCLSLPGRGLITSLYIVLCAHAREEEDALCSHMLSWFG